MRPTADLDRVRDLTPDELHRLRKGADTAEVDTALARFVLYELAAICDHDGMCWPSVAYLSRVTSMGDRRVRRALAALSLAGFVESAGYRNRCRRRRLVLPDLGRPRPTSPRTPTSYVTADSDRDLDRDLGRPRPTEVEVDPSTECAPSAARTHTVNGAAAPSSPIIPVADGVARVRAALKATR